MNEETNTEATNTEATEVPNAEAPSTPQPLFNTETVVPSTTEDTVVKSAVVAETTTPEVTEDTAEATVYAPVQTRVLTPEQAAVEAVENVAASSVDRRAHVEATTTPTEFGIRERRFERDTIVEVVDDGEGFPIASSGEEYEQRLREQDANAYQGTHEEAEEGEPLNK
jgi:hypothetical protein